MDMICNMDCLNCVHDDCINDSMTAADYRAERELEEYIRPKTLKEMQIAAKQREYREANREQIAAKQLEYYEANREQIAAKQKRIADARKKHGYTQKELARLIGVSFQLVGHWECGRLMADYEKLIPVLPELKGN